MNRRVLGAGLLCGVLLLVVIASGLSGQRTAGTPVAAPVRPAPSVGDCQLEVTSEADALGNRLPSPELSPCSGARVGEVMVVFPDYAAAGTVSPGSVSPLEVCSDELNGYLGQPGDPAQPGTWAPALAVDTGLVYPTPQQRAAGQRWAACMVYPLQGEGGSQQFNGPVRDVMRRPGADSAALSACFNELGRKPVSCLAPHRVEVFAWMTVQLGTTRAQLQTSCTELVKDLTLMPDPTAAGALTISGALFPVDGGLSGDYRASFALCAVIVTDPDRALTSTLRNLADRPVPFS
ncbi:septum formation family protein [Nakamurella sp. GG22]